jgi:hypothetical protein
MQMSRDASFRGMRYLYRRLGEYCTLSWIDRDHGVGLQKITCYQSRVMYCYMFSLSLSPASQVKDQPGSKSGSQSLGNSTRQPLSVVFADIQMNRNRKGHARTTVRQALTSHSIPLVSSAGTVGGDLIATSRYARMQRFDVQPSDIIMMSRETRKRCLIVDTERGAKDDSVSTTRGISRSRDQVVAADHERRMDVDQVE